MKRNVLTGVVVLTAAVCLFPALARATDVTGDDSAVSTAPAIPDDCISPSAPTGDTGDPGQDWPNDGPARITHRVSVSSADCSEIDGICVVLVKGPKGDPGPNATPPQTMLRGVNAVVGAPQDEVVIDPCAGVDPACVITMVGEKGPDGPPGTYGTAAPGPGRIVHARPSIPEEVWVDIPQACQDVLSAVAIPTTGSDTSMLLQVAATLMGLGGLIVLTQRRFARR